VLNDKSTSVLDRGAHDSRLRVSGQRTHPNGLKVKSPVQVGLSPSGRYVRFGVTSVWPVTLAMEILERLALLPIKTYR
jgi:hypothetical protein